MFDLVLLAFFVAMLLLGLRRPFLWVLAYIYVDIVAPQSIGWGIMSSVQPSLIAFMFAFASWLLFDTKQGTRITFRHGLLIALLLWCGFTTATADFPVYAAVKWAWVWKCLLFAIFLPLVLRSVLRIEAMILVMVLSLSAIVISGGIKTLLSGGGYGVLVTLSNQDSGIYESSTLSTVAVIAIPLIWWLARNGTIFAAKTGPVTLFAIAATFACLLIPIGTQTRTGLLCIGLLAALLLQSMRHKFLYAGALGVLALAAIPFLPQSYEDRMATIVDHQSDQSASTRIEIWKWTWDFAIENPLGGGFDSYRANSFTYETVNRVEEGSNTRVVRETVTEKGRAFHSAYFEVLGEQGFPGLAMWLLLHASGVIAMARLRRRGRRSADEELQRLGSLAQALLYAQLVYLLGALFIGIAYQPFVFMIIGAQIALARLVGDRDLAAKEIERQERRAARRAARTGEGQGALA